RRDRQAPPGGVGPASARQRTGARGAAGHAERGGAGASGTPGAWNGTAGGSGAAGRAAVRDLAGPGGGGDAGRRRRAGRSGHLSTLRAARKLGDCLIVCLNSDRSVRSLKGPTRPVVPQTDRARLVAALDCVDAVVTFDELTPDRLLDRLRPDIWVKGGDYFLDGPDGEPA